MDASDLLRAAGWFPGRTADVIDQIGSLEREDFTVTPSARRVLNEYAGLSIVGPGNPNPLVMGGPDLAVDTDSGWCDLYSEATGKTLTPVGEYSYMVLYVDEDGEFWGGFDEEYGWGGASLTDVVQRLFLDQAGWHLDRRLPSTEDC